MTSPSQPPRSASLSATLAVHAARLALMRDRCLTFLGQNQLPTTAGGGGPDVGIHFQRQSSSHTLFPPHPTHTDCVHADQRAGGLKDKRKRSAFLFGTYCLMPRCRQLVGDGVTCSQTTSAKKERSPAAFVKNPSGGLPWQQSPQ